LCSQSLVLSGFFLYLDYKGEAFLSRVLETFFSGKTNRETADLICSLQEKPKDKPRLRKAQGRNRAESRNVRLGTEGGTGISLRTLLKLLPLPSGEAAIASDGHEVGREGLHVAARIIDFSILARIE